VNTLPGEFARTPFDIPARGWLLILRRVLFTQLSRDHVGLIAAGVAFYGLLALFPATTALIGIAGMLIDPEAVTSQINAYSGMIPASAASIVQQQVNDVGATQTGALTLVAVVGLSVAVYSASKGVGSLIEGINVAYDQTETRGFIRLLLLRLGLTVAGLVAVTMALGVVIVFPAVLALVDLGQTAEAAIGLIRWVVLLLFVAVGIAALYRCAPDRSPAKWSWLMPGSILACGLWLVATIGFSVYVENFGSYNQSFGALGGVIILLMWFWISAYLVLLGAEVNAEAELQTRYDTTTGSDMPRGTRGAVKADGLVGDESA